MKDVEKQLERDEFFTWFKRQLRQQDTCLKRDVIRDNEKSLWESWKKHKPMGYYNERSGYGIN